MSLTTPQDLASKIAMQGIHVELTPALQNAIRDKCAVILRHDARIIRLHVRLHRDQTLGSESHFTVTSRIEIGGPDLVASVEGKDAYSALDALVEKLDRLLERRHGLRKEQRKLPAGAGIARAAGHPSTP